MDSHSVKTVEESALISGFDVHKHTKGRKRHVVGRYPWIAHLHLRDACGYARYAGCPSPPVWIEMLRPPTEENLGRRRLPGTRVSRLVPSGGGWDLEVAERPPGTRGFSIQPKRWVVERTFAWLSRSRRLSKDYERKVQTSETLIEMAMIRLLVAWLGRQKADVASCLPSNLSADR